MPKKTVGKIFRRSKRRTQPPQGSRIALTGLPNSDKPEQTGASSQELECGSIENWYYEGNPSSLDEIYNSIQHLVQIKPEIDSDEVSEDGPEGAQLEDFSARTPSAEVPSSPVKLWRSGRVPEVNSIKLKVQLESCSAERTQTQEIPDSLEIQQTISVGERGSSPSFDPQGKTVPVLANIGSSNVGSCYRVATKANSKMASVSAGASRPSGGVGKPAIPIPILLLTKQLPPRLPPGWTLRFQAGGSGSDGGGGVYAVLMTSGLLCMVRRAVYVAFNGRNFHVQVHNNILPDSHAVYRDKLLRTPVPLTVNNVELFSSVIVEAVNAVSSFELCIGVDLPHCVQEWQKHVNCKRENNDFEEKGYVETLRTDNCSYLVPRRHKRCAGCAGYLKTLKKREARREKSQGVKKSSNMSPTRLKEMLRARADTIRLEEKKLQQRSPIDKIILQDEGVEVDQYFLPDFSYSDDDAEQVL